MKTIFETIGYMMEGAFLVVLAIACVIGLDYWINFLFNIFL